MQIEYFAAGKNVINYGEIGDKFYIIVQGQVGVWVPFNFSKALKASMSVIV